MQCEVGKFQLANCLRNSLRNLIQVGLKFLLKLDPSLRTVNHPNASNLPHRVFSLRSQSSPLIRNLFRFHRRELFTEHLPGVSRLRDTCANRRQPINSSGPRKLRMFLQGLSWMELATGADTIHIWGYVVTSSVSIISGGVYPFHAVQTSWSGMKILQFETWNDAIQSDLSIKLTTYRGSAKSILASWIRRLPNFEDRHQVTSVYIYSGQFTGGCSVWSFRLLNIPDPMMFVSEPTGIHALRYMKSVLEVQVTVNFWRRRRRIEYITRHRECGGHTWTFMSGMGYT